MLKQTFLVTLEVPSPFARYFPKVEPERMANIIRDGIEAKSVSFIGPTLFTIRVERAEEAAWASGQIRQYLPQGSGEVEQVHQELIQTLEAQFNASDCHGRL